MKRKKIFALLCVAATSASLVTPVMAEENQATGTTQEAPVEEVDESNVEQKEESNADVEQSETEKVVSEEKNEPSENITEDTESETSTDETVLDKNLTESLDVDEEVKDGFVEEDGSVYYYEAGKKVTNTIRDFEDESGFEYSCYFDWSGRMMIDSEEWVEYTDENGKSHDGIIRADENGYLIIDDWYQNQDGSWNYYKKDFLRAENEVVEKYGKQYYLDSDGILVTDSQLTIGGQLYQADASGAIILIQASAKEHWVKTNGKWYLFVDNKLVKDKFYLYKGDYYYFDNNGEMQTGSFDTEDGKAYIADSNGIVIYTPTEGWNKTKDGKTWCYYKKDSDGNLYLLRGEFLSYSGSNTTSIGQVLWQLEYLKPGKMMMIIITLPIIVAKFSKSQIGFTMRENGIIQKTESCTLMELKQLVVKNTISCIMQRCFQGILQKHIMTAVKLII